MADQKITELGENTTPVSTDLTVIVDDPGGTPATQKMTLDTLDDYLSATAKTLTNKTLTSPVLGGTPVLDADSAIPFYHDSISRQAIINGNFDVWQRGTSIAMTTADAYAADRWYCETATAATDKTVSRQTAANNGSYYSCRVAAVEDVDALVTLSQALESQDSIKFRGSKLTLSFYAKAGAEFVSDNATLTCKIVSGKGTDQKVLAFTTSADEISADKTLTDTFVKHTITTTAVIASDITQVGISFAFTHAGAGVTTNYFEIAQVQLCAGEIALPFQPKSYAQELADCKRHANKIISATAYGMFGTGWAESTTLGQFAIPTGVTMRAKPTITTSGSFRVLNAGAIDVASFNLIDYSSNHAQIRTTVAGGQATGECLILQNKNDATAYILLDSEL